MKLSTLAKLARTCVTDPRAILVPKEYVFLVSHMRSYSTLLSHILGSHRDIAGHHERLMAYRDRTDLTRARFEESLAGSSSRYRYLLDKVLHDEYTLAGSILDRADVRLLVFVRHPAKALPSMVRLTQVSPLGDRFDGLPRLTEHYVTRLERIVADASRASKRALYFDAEAIVQQSDALLEGLSTWLGLSEPLSAQYEVFRDTGERYRGDVSDRISQGRIVPKSAPEQEVEIPPRLLAEAEAAYVAARSRLMAVCETIASNDIGPG